MNLNEILQNVLAEDNSAFFYTPSVYVKGKSYFFLSPVEVIETSDPSEFETKLKKIDKLLNKGLVGYGYLSYEAGYTLEKKLKNFSEHNSSLMKFCLFREDDVQIFKSKNLKIDKWNENSFDVCSFALNTQKETYIQNIHKIKNYIAEGDTYQVNYTVKGKFDFYGSPASFFKKLIFNQSAKYSAFINSGEDLLISLSPELFFSTKGDEIATKPMKGTIKRGFNIEDDFNQLLALKNSKKNKAENLMIVDLLRNDLGRISRYGSVKVKNFFEIEKYESLFQKVSSVSARLDKNICFSNIIKNIFPSGSITGAPKISTMEIIRELEPEKRGIYTGAIGIVKKDESVFNVAIRTININKKSGRGELGIGSGIVWDSNPEKEYEETLLKADFLLKPSSYFEIFETILIETGKAFLLEKHIERMKSAAEFFLFNVNEEKILKAIIKRIKVLSIEKKYRMKIVLNKWGHFVIEVNEFPLNPVNVKITISTQRIDSKDKYRFFKTTNRKMYNLEHAKYTEEGFFDVIFLNDYEEVCEGAITNIFIRKGNNWLTPPVSCGLLPGVFRNYWMEKNPGIKEEKIYLDDLKNADEIILTNSLRRVIKVSELV